MLLAWLNKGHIFKKRNLPTRHCVVRCRQISSGLHVTTILPSGTVCSRLQADCQNDKHQVDRFPDCKKNLRMRMHVFIIHTIHTLSYVSMIFKSCSRSVSMIKTLRFSIYKGNVSDWSWHSQGSQPKSDPFLCTCKHNMTSGFICWLSFMDFIVYVTTDQTWQNFWWR